MFGSVKQVCTAIALLSVTSVAAFAITSDDFKYSSKQQGYLSINPMAFYPDGSSSATSYFVSWSSGSLDANGTDNDCFQTAINLPNGAEMTALTIFSRTPDSSGVFVNFESLALGSGDTKSVVSGTFGAGSSSRTSQTKNIAKAKSEVKQTLAYGLGVCLDPGETFFGARIEYTYKKAGS